MIRQDTCGHLITMTKQTKTRNITQSKIRSANFKHIFELLFLVAFAVTSGAYSEEVNALDLDVRSSRSSMLDVSLQIERASVDFESSSAELTANLRRIGIISIDVPSSGPQFGLLLGYAFSDFSNTSSFGAIDMDGYYIGVLARGTLLRHGPLSLSLLGHYLYQSVDGAADMNVASLDWDELSATAQIEYRLDSIGVLFAGFKTGSIDAHYKERGAVNTSIYLDDKNKQGFVAGFSYEVNRLEFLSVSYQSANSEGVALRFQKWF